jgi:outer membrane protein TolC
MATTDTRLARAARTLALSLAAALLSGCAALSPDAGFDGVRQVSQRLAGHEPVWARDDEARRQLEARVAQLLREPLSADSAVQVALLNNRHLQAAFEELGIADAERVQALSWPNPGFSFARTTRGDEVELERGLHLNIGRLLAMPLVREVETRRFARAQGLAATAVLQLVADTRKAWVQAVAARQALQYAKQVMDAAEAGAELARRMAAVGNFNKLQLAREQSFYADAALALARAEQAERGSRERLTRLLGLWGDQAGFGLPDRLPDLPEAARDLPQIERQAIAERLDVQGARLAVEQAARQLGLTRVTRFVDVLEFGVMRNSSNEAPTQKGWEIGLQIPLFDFGGARQAKVEAQYRQSVARAAATAIDARSEVREAYGAYRTAWDIARHQRDERVPLARRISDENLLRYNGMLIGVFELLADARSQIATVQAAIEAQRDFWLAQADLDMALIGKPGLDAAAAIAAAMPGAAAAGSAPH